MRLLENYYGIIKIVHVTCVIASSGLFLLRGVWLIQQSSQLSQHWVRVVPHVIDTFLLLSAVLLSIAIQQYPFTHDWLTAKALALLLYIGLGMVAIRHHRSRQVAIVSWIAAVLVLGYIILTAITHSPSLGYR